MKIAQVITLFLPDFSGGATLACAAAAQALRARGHDVEIFCGRPHGDGEPYAETHWEVDGIPVHGVNAAAGYDPFAERAFRHPEVAPAFTRFLDRMRPDVVHFHSIQALGGDLLALAAARASAVVLTMHDWWWWCARLFLVDQHDFVCPPRVDPARCHCAPGFDFGARRAHLDACLAHVDRILTPSRVLAAAAIANGVAADRVRVLANGVAACGPRHGARRPGPIRFGWFGGPDARLKGLPTLLAAAERMVCGGFEIVLYAAGATIRRGLVRRLVDRVGSTVPIPLAIDDRIRIAPPFAPAALPATLRALDCLVVPSLMRESFSLVTREALGAGIPVIVSDSGGPLEIVRPETNGLVFATGDADDLAACMRRLVLEPGLIETLAAGAAHTAIADPATQTDALEAIYTEARAEHRARGAGALPAAPRSRRPAADGIGPVLFLAGADGAPYRYRVAHLRELLAQRGVAARALWWSDPGAPAAIAAARLLVVYRAPISPWLEACLAYARARGTPLVFSCDDLLFDAAATPHDALAGLPENERAWWLAATDRYAATLRACDAFLGATEPLAAAAARLGRPAFVARNGLGRRELAVVEALAKARRPPSSRDPVVFAYMSGTTMHELDFATIAPTLAGLLAARRQVRLRLGGHLRLHPALAPFADRIERLPFLPWHEAYAALASADVQLAPLRSDAFSDAKSEVKYLEAAALGIPTVATPTHAFRRAIRSGENGILAATPEAWSAALLALADDRSLRRRLGNRAREDVFLHATPEVQAESLVAALAAIVAAAPAGSEEPPSDAVAAPPTPASFAAEVGCSALAPDDLDPGTAVEASDTPSGFLLAGRSIGQRFRASADDLCRIDVRVGTDGRRHDQRLVFRLADAADATRTVLRTGSVDAATLADGAWAAASFAPLAASAGRELYLWIESADAVDSAVTLWTWRARGGGVVTSGLHLDHAPASGSLTFRTYHRPRAART